MTDNERAASVGTAYFPELDVPSPVARPGTRQAPGRLRSLPRRRRPAMIALAVALVGAGIVLSAAIYQQAGHRLAVIMVTRAVPAGAVITPGDVGTTSVAVSGAIDVIPAAELGRVVGKVAAAPLSPDTLLAPSQLSASRPPAPGQALVAAPIRPADLPASGLAPGDRVLIVATPGDQGQAGVPVAPSLAVPARGVVEAVTRSPDSDGFLVVDLLVGDADAVAVASQVSTGQFALIVTGRG